MCGIASGTCLGRQAEHVAAGQLQAGQARRQRAVAREGHDRHVVVPMQRGAMDPQHPAESGSLAWTNVTDSACAMMTVLM